MPDLSGLEVLRRIREHYSAAALPVIMITAKSAGTDVAEALEAGANDYVTKPVDFVVALARTNTQLALRRAEADALLGGCGNRRNPESQRQCEC